MSKSQGEFLSRKKLCRALHSGMSGKMTPLIHEMNAADAGQRQQEPDRIIPCHRDQRSPSLDHRPLSFLLHHALLPPLLYRKEASV